MNHGTQLLPPEVVLPCFQEWLYSHARHLSYSEVLIPSLAEIREERPSTYALRIESSRLSWFPSDGVSGIFRGRYLGKFHGTNSSFGWTTFLGRYPDKWCRRRCFTCRGKDSPRFISPLIVTVFRLFLYDHFRHIKPGSTETQLNHSQLSAQKALVQVSRAPLFLLAPMALLRPNPIPIFPLPNDVVLLPGAHVRVPVRGNSYLQDIGSYIQDKGQAVKTGQDSKRVDSCFGCVPVSSEVNSDANTIGPGGQENLFGFGTLSEILGVEDQGTTKTAVVIRGISRIKVQKISKAENLLMAEVTYPDNQGRPSDLLCGQ